VCGEGSDCNPTPDGREYTGHESVTANGRQCQAWTSQSPHSHSYGEDDMFPGGSAEAASNYCRNPDDNYSGLWCYTMDPDIRWEKCDVPICGQSLRYVNLVFGRNFYRDKMLFHVPVYFSRPMSQKNQLDLKDVRLYFI